MIYTPIDIAFQSVHIFIACIALAFVEIQVEGQHGWAKNLPTWRDQPPWAAKDSLAWRAIRGIFRYFSGGNQLTGYHLSLMSFLFVILLLPVSFAQDKPHALLLCIGWLSIMSVVWDFLWFVFNAHYGLRRFKPEFIAWHPRWLGPVPTAYYFGLLSGSAFIILGSGDPALTWMNGVIAVSIQLVGTCLCMIVAHTLIKRV